MSLMHSAAHANLPKKVSGYVTTQTAPQAPTVSAWKSVVHHTYNAFLSSSTGEAIPQYSSSTGWDIFATDWGDAGISVGPDTTGAITSQQADLGGGVISPTDSAAATAYGYGGYNG